jgi:transporter family protein
MSWVMLTTGALIAWTVSGLVTKASLKTFSPAQFLFFQAVIELVIAIVVAALSPVSFANFPFGVAIASLATLSFWLMLKALERGPLSRVLPMSSSAPAVTALLAVSILKETVSLTEGVGIVAALSAVILIGMEQPSGTRGRGWLPFALGVCIVGGIRSFLTKVFVVSVNPSTYLLSLSLVDCATGFSLVRYRREPWLPKIPRRIVVAMAIALSCATIAFVGYLKALTIGPVSLIAPFVSLEIPLGSILGAMLFREPLRPMSLAGIILAMLGGILLTT